jgi:hypothetical protein
MNHRLILLLVALCALTAAAFADNAADIRRRMEQRLPQLDDLKAREVVGENNRGLLELRGTAPGAADLVNEENRDRQAVYALIARETGATPEQVGKARAKKIAENSKAGVWLQDEAGRWRRK